MNKSAEDYIKTIYILKRANKHIRSVDVARKLGFSKASVSLAMANLRENGLITMKENGEIEFTSKGKKLAKSKYDKYVMLCGFLRDVAGVDENTAKDDAWRIGYYLSDSTYAGIRQYIDRM